VSISNEQFIENNFQVFPNPTADFISIKNLNSTLVEVQLFDLYGKKKFENIVVENIEITVKHFSKGIYFLHLSSEYGWGVKKILIE